MPTVAAILLVGILPALTSCSNSVNTGVAGAVSDPQIPISDDRDDSFGLSFNVVEVPGSRTLETGVLQASYTANNGYETAGQVLLGTLSIIHEDGTLLAEAPMNDRVDVPPRNVVSDFVDLSLDILDRQRLTAVLESHDRALQEKRAAQEKAGDNATSGTLEDLNRGYVYEVTWRLEHPTRPPSRRRVRF